MHTFETFTAPIGVKLYIPINVATFGGISLIASELNQIESQRKKVESQPDFPKQRGYRLIAFEVHSQPQVSVLADPSWLAVYIALLALGLSCIQILGSYSSIKSGAKELAGDFNKLKGLVTKRAREVANSIDGLSHEQLRDLVLGVELYVDSMTDTVEKAEAIIRRATRFASILSRKNMIPHVAVKTKHTLERDR